MMFWCFVLQEERVLFHYNGHGVPRPTLNGEIWVFNKVIKRHLEIRLFLIYFCKEYRRDDFLKIENHPYFPKPWKIMTITL